MNPTRPVYIETASEQAGKGNCRECFVCCRLVTEDTLTPVYDGTKHVCRECLPEMDPSELFPPRGMSPAVRELFECFRPISPAVLDYINGKTDKRPTP